MAVSVNTRPDRCPHCQDDQFREIARVEADISSSVEDEILYICNSHGHEFTWCDGDNQSATPPTAAGVTRKSSDVDGEPVPKRVREAEERREFRDLLRAAIPVTDEDIRAIATGQCQPCRNDRCGDTGCAIPTGCACTCTTDKRVLSSQIIQFAYEQQYSLVPEDADEIADALYREGWRRE